MNKESMLHGIIGLLTGLVIAGFTATAAVYSHGQGTMHMKCMHPHNGTGRNHMMHDDDMSMGDMTTHLKGKTGDDFDKAFLSEMIEHHQGAIDMANLAKQNAKHDEIKNLANDIVAAQTKEINDMQSWQQGWNYGSSDSNHMHRMMN